MKRRLLAQISALLMLTLLWGGCQRWQSALSTTQADPALVDEHGRWLPADAQLVSFWPNLEVVEQLLAVVQTRWPSMKPWISQRCALTQDSPLSICQPTSWPQLGINQSSGVGVFIQDGQLGLSVSLKHPDALTQALKAKLDAGQRWRLEARDDHSVLIVDDQERLAILEREQVALLLLSSPSNPKPGQWAQQLARLPAQARWDQDAQHRQLTSRLYNPTSAFWVVNPASAFLSLPAESAQAISLRQRMAELQGKLGISMAYNASARRLSAQLYSQDAPQEATVVRDLRGASQELPPLGALISPGALGVVRVSASVEALNALWLSTLTQPQREQLSSFESHLRDELSIDLKDALWNNLTGHMVMVLYGLTPEVFAKDLMSALKDVFALQATREAILLTLHDGSKLARALDAATQLSQGKLRRQGVGEQIQYAWFEQGELRWALLVHSDYVIYIDSPVAYARAMQHIRRPEPLKPSWQTTNLQTLLTERDRSGLYLDINAWLGLLPEAQRAILSPWLSPVKSLLLSADSLERASVMTLELTLKDHP